MNVLSIAVTVVGCGFVDATVRTGDLSMGVKIDQLEEVSSGNRKYVQCSISGQR